MSLSVSELWVFQKMEEKYKIHSSYKDYKGLYIYLILA